MTVRELKEDLEKYPDDMEIYMDLRKSEFTFGLLNSTRKQTINMKEDPYDEVVLATLEVVILDEE